MARLTCGLLPGAAATSWLSAHLCRQGQPPEPGSLWGGSRPPSPTSSSPQLPPPPLSLPWLPRKVLLSLRSHRLGPRYLGSPLVPWCPPRAESPAMYLLALVGRTLQLVEQQPEGGGLGLTEWAALQGPLPGPLARPLLSTLLSQHQAWAVGAAFLGRCPAKCCLGPRLSLTAPYRAGLECTSVCAMPQVPHLNAGEVAKTGTSWGPRGG